MRLRLTLWFVLGVVVVVLAGAFAMYGVLSRQLNGELDSKLNQQLARYQQMVSSAADEQALADLTKTYLAGPQSNPLRQGGYVFSIQTSGGTVVSNSSDVTLEDLPQTKALLESGKSYATDIQTAGQSYRVLGAPILLTGSQMGAAEIAGSLGSINDTLSRLVLLLAVGGALGCIVVGLGSWVLVGRALDPVRRITRTAAAISHEDLTQRIRYVGPSDEIGELARTMDAMLDRLQSAFSTQEQFISDVSHELRTPLTIMKGHLQVLDRQESPDPDFVRQEHLLVLDELDRMNRLVADLLTLARATRIDFLRKEEINLDAFLRSLVSQGPHLGERSWLIDALPTGTIRADQDRLTQVFLNLMQNAVAHTRPGDVIALGGERRGRGPAGGNRSVDAQASAAVDLWVRDEGEGMTEATAERVFERFYRGVRETGAGESLGLGLAIVRAIVEAHGGAVSVESAPGEGSRFTVALPA